MNVLMKIFLALMLILFSFGAFSEEASLRKIDFSFIQSNFIYPGIDIIEEDMNKENIWPGCNQSKRFSFLNDYKLSKILVALCNAGAYGPQSYQASIDASLEPFIPKIDANLKLREESKLINGDTIRLKNNRIGRIFWMPFIGHGIVFIPTAIAPSNDSMKTILIQIEVDMDIEKNPNLLKSMSALLRAIDAHL